LLERISVTEYLNYEDGKFSKSRGVGVFGNDARDTDIPADVFRYYLLSIRPEQGDSEFRWSDLAVRNNSELVNNLGNYCHRVLDFISKRFDGVVPEVSAVGAGLVECLELGRELRWAVDLYIDNLEKTRLRDGLKSVLTVSSIGNSFLNKCEPWKSYKVNPEKAKTHLAAAAGVVRLLAALLSPFTPSVASVYLHYLGLEAESGLLTEELLAAVHAPQTLLPPEHQLGPAPRAVFSKIDSAQVEALRSRFAGKTALVEKASVAKVVRKKQREHRQSAEASLQIASVAA